MASRNRGSPVKGPPPTLTTPPHSPGAHDSPHRPQTTPLLSNCSPRQSQPVLHTSSNSKGLNRLAPAAIFLVAFVVAAVDNLRLRYGSNARVSSVDRDPTPHRGGGPTYSILPKKIYSVIGLESSGTQFVSKIIEQALGTTGPYREGSAPCRETCADDSDQCRVKKEIIEGHECVEASDVRVQHFSMPWGGTCHEHPNPPVVDVVLPPQCTRDHDDPTEIKECDAMASDIWGLELNGKRMKYPIRYQLDIVKSKEWYDAQGVEQIFVIVVRDDKISFAARGSHCKSPALRRQEEEVGTQLIVDAINKYILKGEGDELSSETLNRWVAKQYQQDGGIRRKLSAIPSRDGVVVVSYESLVKLGGTYVKMLYDALGIESDFLPDVKDSNAKYLNPTFT